MPRLESSVAAFGGLFTRKFPVRLTFYALGVVKWLRPVYRDSAKRFTEFTANGTSRPVEWIGHAVTTLCADDGRVFLVPNHHITEQMAEEEPRGGVKLSGVGVKG